jgi:hypothetical protein
MTMKIRQLFLSGRAGKDWRMRAVLGLAATFLAGVPAFAGAPGPGPTAAGDDETVGTLPILGPEWDVFGASKRAIAVRPCTSKGSRSTSQAR